MKRFLSFMMVLALIFSMSVNAFAEGEDEPVYETGGGSITITNATVGDIYSIYKIFDATFAVDEKGDVITDTATGKKIIAYSITTGNQFYGVLFGEDGKTENEFFTYNAATGVVTRKDGKTDAEIVGYLKGIIKAENANYTATAEPITATNKTVLFDNLPYGYYIIAKANGAAVTIDSNTPDVEVIDKNQTTITLDKQIKLSSDAVYDADDSISANVDDIVDFKVEFTALNYKGDTKITKYTIEDALNPLGWAAIDTNSIVVKVGTKTLVAGTDYNIINANTDGFKIDIGWMDDAGKEFLYDSSAKVEVTYAATVLDAAANATPAENKNAAKLTWADTTAEDDTTTKVYNLGFKKVDGADNTPLAGAKFGLYSDNTCTTPVNIKTTTVDGVYIFDKESGSNIVETFADGQVVIMGLKEGTYYLKELDAPAGYNKLEAVKDITIGGNVNNTVKTSYTVNNDVPMIENNKGMELPETGGEGTARMITIGSIVAMAFAVLLITHKKMSVYHD